MLIRDEATQARLAYEREQDEELDGILRKVREAQRQSSLLTQADLDPTDFEARQGRALPDHEVEMRLCRINPNFVFTPHPKNPTKKLMYLKAPEGLRYVMPYEAGKIPENSILELTSEYALTPEGAKQGFEINKADLPKAEITPHEFDEAGRLTKVGGVEFEQGKALPGLQELKIPGRTVVRGYREMLNWLMIRGFITLADAEREFGTQNNYSWAAATGRTQRVTPW